jgi:hypothetical protein
VEFGLQECKTIGRVIEVAPTKAVDSARDALLKSAKLALEEPELFWPLWARAIAYMRHVAQTGEAWKTQDLRDLKRRRREVAELREHAEQEERRADCVAGRPNHLRDTSKAL